MVLFLVPENDNHHVHARGAANLIRVGVAQGEACCDTCFGFGGQVIGVGWWYIENEGEHGSEQCIR